MQGKRLTSSEIFPFITWAMVSQAKTVRLQEEKIEKSVSNFSNIKNIFILTLGITCMLSFLYS